MSWCEHAVALCPSDLQNKEANKLKNIEVI